MRKSTILALSLAATLVAQAKNVYVACDWSGYAGTVPASQVVKFYDNATCVGSATVTAANGWKACASVSYSGNLTVTPVYPTGGYSSTTQRDYGCKAKVSVASGEQIYVTYNSSTFWQSYNGDVYTGYTVYGWLGSKKWSAWANGDAVYCKPLSASVDPIFDVVNRSLSYSATDVSVTYDGSAHGIGLTVSTGGCTVEYSADNATWSGTKPTYVNVGAYRTYFRISKDGQTVVTDSRTVTITEGTISYSAWDNEYWYSGSSYGIGLSVSTGGCTVQYSATGGDGSWITDKPTYGDVGVYTTYFRISKANYTTVTGSRTVTIKALRDMTCSVSDYRGIYDGKAHGISVSVSVPNSNFYVYYATSENGSYSRWYNNSYTAVGEYTVWYRITSTGYKTVSGSAKVVIEPKPITGPDDIDNPGNTNTVYSGGYPWGNTSKYTVDYGPWGYGWGWGWVVFHGTNNYTGVWSNRYYIAKRPVTIQSGSSSRNYNGFPLTCDNVTSNGFVSGEGLATSRVFGSQTEVGYSPNHFEYTLKANTDPDNYDIHVVTGRLTVTAVTPVSMKYPAKIELVGTNRIVVGVEETYTYRVTYSDGTTSSYVSPNPQWSFSPGAPAVTMEGDGSSRRLTAYPAGAGSVHTLSIAHTNTYATHASVTNGLVAWYPFDGSRADVSIYNKIISMTGASWTSDRTETDSRAYWLAGTASSYGYAYDSSAVARATNALSVAAWIRPESYDRLGLCARRGQFSLRFRQNGDWVFNGQTFAANAPVVTGQWQHVALTYDGTTLRAYLNGVFRGSATCAAKPDAGTGYFYLGRSIDKDGTTSYFQGSVDDVRVFETALSADKVVAVELGSDVVWADSEVSVAAEKEISVDPHCRIPVALDVETPEGATWPNGGTKFTFTTGSTSGESPWCGQFSTYCPGVAATDAFDYDAAQSGAVPHGGTSWMQTSVSDAGTLSFWWKADCEQTYDYVVFKDSGKELARLSGATDWQQVAFDLPKAAHTLRWEYVKDGKKSVGADAVWIDRLVWTALDVPKRPDGVSTLVNATDGEYDDCVYVTWSEPLSSRTITGYQVYRRTSSTAYAAISPEITARAFTDVTAEPGVKYWYKVEAKNAMGWGSCGEDTGYRAVIIAIDPTSHHFSNVPTGERVVVTVTSNALWKVQPQDSWLHAQISNGCFIVTADETPYSYRRTGHVRVYGGLAANQTLLDYYRFVDLTVTQSASIDIAFMASSVDPYRTWRTSLQITTNDLTVLDTYSPVSVFPQGAGMKIAFGWENKSDVSVDLPPVKFTVYTPTNGVAMSWKDDGSSVGGEKTLAAHAKSLSGYWNGENLKALPAGDYKLVAELDPDSLLDDPVKANNKTEFRFAVRDLSLQPGVDVFADEVWTNLAWTVGNDYAQAPHVASRYIELDEPDPLATYTANAVQFGPYVPMNGWDAEEVSHKKPVDVVFLVDYTGSMDSCIAGLINNIGVFIDQLLVGDAEHGIDPIPNLRIKIVGFSDYLSDCGYKSWFNEGAFTTDRKELKAKLDELREQCYGGGGNGGESSFDALYYVAKSWSTVWDGATQPTTYAACTSPFRGTNEAARAVILFTDEPPVLPDGKMSAPGCANKTVADLDAALKEAAINLTLIGDGWYYQEYPEYAENIHYLSNLVALADDRSLKETGGAGTIASFTQDTEMLRDLAVTVYDHIPEIVTIVEPTFTAMARGEGVLKFRWCNESIAGDDNVFTFEAPGVTNMTRTADRKWVKESIPLGEGLHPFKWSYKKTDYDGDVSDCGLIADVTFAPEPTSLEITPNPACVDCYGVNETQFAKALDGATVTSNKLTGAIYKVKCNAAWKVTSHDDWINLVQDNGEGDGHIVITVQTNMTYKERTGIMTVVAGEDHGNPGDIVTKIVKVVQSRHPYVPGPLPQIIEVGVKPRWPWNDTVDIDYRVVLDDKNTPVNVSFRGLDREADGIGYEISKFAAIRAVTPKAGTYEGVLRCTESGLYRITWNEVGKSWASGNTSTPFPKADGFHTPALAVELVVQAESGSQPVTNVSDNVRVDTRVYAVKAETSSVSGKATGTGGTIMTGTESIGYVLGTYDPVSFDTTTLSNGWNTLNSVAWQDGASTNEVHLSGNYTNDYSHAFVINGDDVVVEGGIIATDTVWRANKTHIVRDNIFIAKGATLTIAPDTVVKLCYYSRIYVFKDPDKKDQDDEYNLRAKGAYFVGAFDSSIDGDSSYTDFAYAIQEDSSQGGGSVTAYRFFDQDFVSVINTDSPKKSGILRVGMSIRSPSKSGSMVSTSWRYRFYSQGEIWGDLPRPSIEDNSLVYYGWVRNASVSASDYAKGTYAVDPTGIPLTSNSYVSTTIYALFRDKDWATPRVGKLDASAGEIVLKTTECVYDGLPHTPVVSGFYVNDKELSGYKVVAPTVTTVGVYDVSLDLSETIYENPPVTNFTIRPREVAGGSATLSSSRALYRPTWAGGIDKPTVTQVAILGMQPDTPNAGFIPADDLADVKVKWLDDTYWPWPGTYHVEIAFNGNYVGTMTNTFVIEENPEYFFTSTSDKMGKYAAKTTAADAVASAKAQGKRILYFAAPDPEDISTEAVRKAITDDIPFNEWVSTNFVVWVENATNDSFAAYSEGMDFVSYPLLCVLNPDDLATPITRTCGYQTKENLRDFLEASLRSAVDAKAVEISIRPGKEDLVYSGETLVPAAEDLLLTYGGAELTPDQFTIIATNDSVNVGVYELCTRINPSVYFGDYVITGETASVNYRVVPRAVYDGMDAAVRAKLGIGLDPTAVAYDGNVHRPNVTSVVAYASMSYGEDDWYNVGTHTLTATFDGNYKGTVSETFSITAKVVSATVQLDRYSEAVVGGKSTESLKPTVMRVFDSSTGISYVQDVDYTIDFGGGDYKSPSTNYVTATFIGNYSGIAKARFVITGSEASDELPDVSDDASPDDIKAALETVEWTDPAVTVGITNAADYAGFKAWTEAIGSEAAKGASNAYVSYRVSELIEGDTNLASVARVSLVMTDVEVASSGTSVSEIGVVVQLKDGATAFEFTGQLDAAKKSFARLVRRSNDLNTLDAGFVDAKDVGVESVAGDRTKVRLTVLPPAGAQGFIKLKLE